MNKKAQGTEDRTMRFMRNALVAVIIILVLSIFLYKLMFVASKDVE